MCVCKATLAAALTALLAAAPAACGDGPPAATPRLDPYGDPLPADAVARLGSARFRHGGEVTGLAYSADGKVLATAGADHSLSLWDAATGKELRRFRSPDLSARAVALSPDGKVLAEVGYSNVIRLWDTATGALLRTAGGEERLVTALRFAPDGGTFLTAGYRVDGGRSVAEVVLRRTATGAVCWRVDDWGGYGPVAFSADGKRVACGRHDPPELSLRDAASGREVRRLDGLKPVALAYAPDGKALACGCEDGTVRLLDPQTGGEVRRLAAHKKAVHFVAYCDGGKWLVSAGGDGSVRLWDGAGREVRRLAVGGSADLPQPFALAADGRLAGGRSDLRFWEVKTGTEVPQRPAGGGSVAFSPDGRVVATGDGGVRLWAPTTGKLLRALGGGGASSLGFSPEGKALVAWLHGGGVGLWETAGGRQLHRFRSQEQDGHVSFRAEGKVVTAGGRGRRLQAWDTVTGTGLTPVRLEGSGEGDWRCFAWSPDGKVLAAGRHVNESGEAYRPIPGVVRLWDGATGKLVRVLGGRTPASAGQSVFTLAFAADGERLAAADRRGGVRLWDVTTGRELRPLRRPEKAHATALAFSPDGLLLAAGGPGAVVLWDLATGREACRFRGHRGAVTHLAFSAEGALLASGGTDKTTLVWDVAGATLRKAAPTPKELGRLWAELADADAATAFRAQRALTAAARQSVPFLGEQLRRGARPEEARKLAALIADLDSDRLAVRAQALRELTALGGRAEPALRGVLRGESSLEVRRRVQKLLEGIEETPLPPDELRQMRALTVLEHAGTPDARALLRELADGPAELRLTQRARAALRRLGRR